MRISLIVAAGGSGTRFLKKAPHQTNNKIFHPFFGKPLLIHTLKSFQGMKEIRETVAAVPPGTQAQWRKWQKQFRLSNIGWVSGGKTRAESVWNALRKTDPKSDWVMVHDGARPLVSPTHIRRLIRTAQSKGPRDGVILAKKVVPTIKEVSLKEHRIQRTVNREALCEAETPQLVRRSILMKAYKTNPNAFQATDESALLESAGGRVKAVMHEEWNPKITSFDDLKLVESYVKQKDHEEVRVGFGRDTHRLVPGRKLYLGGIHIPFKRGALGHSDGDTLLHAVSDAILGATGQGDIGEHFSDLDKRLKGIRSTKIIEEVLKKAREKGWAPVHVDTVIILEKPRLGVYKKMIGQKVAGLLKMKEENISIKAKTAEGLGPEGEGLAITCEAIVTMRKI